MSISKEIWTQVILPLDSSIQDVIGSLNEAALKIVMVVDERGELQGTISDGDIRRGLLKGLDLNSSIESIIYRNALVVPPDMRLDMVMQLMIANKIQQIPVVDEHQKIVGLHIWDDMTKPVTRSNIMVIMAGGKGTRLLPFTKNCPKPMVMVAGKPMLEHIIERGKLDGFNHFVLAINYLGHMIEAHFGNGDSLEIKIDYIREESPLGTAGALSLLSSTPDTPFVVTNGDVITDIRYGELLDFHSRHSASATMAVSVHEWQHPYGVVQTEGVEIIGFEEKPILKSHINAGVYVLSVEAMNELTPDTSCDMPTLFERLQAKGKRTIVYPMHEPWLDVGRPSDLELARKNDVMESRPSNNEQ
mgnify:CR=1 FL=1